MSGKLDLTTVAAWVGRKVRIGPNGIAGTEGDEGTVLAVDDTPWQPSAWVRVYEDCNHPAYRSVDIAWLEDIETGEDGPTWGTSGPNLKNRGHSNHSVGTACVGCGSAITGILSRIRTLKGVWMLNSMIHISGDQVLNAEEIRKEELKILGQIADILEGKTQ